MDDDDEAKQQEKPKRVIGKPFPKGVSGNPSGRPPTLREVRDLAQKMSADVIRRLYEIAMDTKINPMACVAASKEILDRACGKSPQIQLDFGAVDGDIIADGDTSGLTALLMRARLEQQNKNKLEH